MCTSTFMRPCNQHDRGDDEVVTRLFQDELARRVAAVQATGCVVCDQTIRALLDVPRPKSL